MLVQIIGWFSLILATAHFCHVLYIALKRSVDASEHYKIALYLIVAATCFK